ncbi:MAG: radical SAM protein [Planctomycetota bacterium]|jgi:hypothetical protein|nr:radical SAM protein [Planctomycetota bacterium]
MVSARDVVTGHVPDGLIYGPVTSRRFGRSLGVSCDAPGQVGCAWACPYCQLGEQPRGRHVAVPAERIIDDLRVALIDHAADCDVVCVAGNGEPTDHPEFPVIAMAVAQLARIHGLRSILLTNGDGLMTPAVGCACEEFDEVHVKFDPGPNDGAWRHFDVDTAERRRAMLRNVPELRIQALIYQGPGESPGNADAVARQRWLTDLVGLPVVSVDLSTVARDTRRAGIEAVDDTVLEQWRRDCDAVLQVPVRVYGAS